jgi:hypothetical protein
VSCQKEGSEYIQLDSRCPYVVQCKTSYRYPLYPNLIGTSINNRALFDIKERFIVSECVRCAGFNEKLLFHHKNKIKNAFLSFNLRIPSYIRYREKLFRCISRGSKTTTVVDFVRNCGLTYRMLDIHDCVRTVQKA